ncbi:MAG: type III pantothenate kinase [Ectothiorhodospiraceae bacterium]
MILLLDVGNSRCKWQLHDPCGVVAAGAHAYTPGGGLAPDLLRDLDELPAAPDRAVACAVAAPQTFNALDRHLRARWNCALEPFVTAAAEHGVVNAYDRTQDLGADRWAALIGARARYAGRVLIVDCGTAVTLDVLEANGRHAGGLILPGVALARRALSTGAHRLDEPGDGALPDLAADTPTAIRAGTFHGLVAAIAGLRASVEAAGGAVTAVLTGGDAQAVGAALVGDWHVDPDLVFTGMLVASGESA